MKNIRLKSLLNEEAITASSLNSFITKKADAAGKITKLNAKIKIIEDQIETIKSIEKVQSEEVSKLVKMINDFISKWKSELKVITKSSHIELIFQNPSDMKGYNKKYFDDLDKIANHIAKSKSMIIGSDVVKWRAYGEPASEVEILGNKALIDIYPRVARVPAV